MEYSLPGPVVALLQEEQASLAPKSYFISSGKKSIKITLVYAKGSHHQSTSSEAGGAMTSAESVHRKKPRHGLASKRGNKSSSHGLRRQVGSAKVSSLSPPDLRRNDLSSGGSPSNSDDTEHACSTPEFNMGSTHGDHQSHVSTVDSGHPPSSFPPSSISNGGSHRLPDDNISVSESDGEEEDVEEDEEEEDGEGENHDHEEELQKEGRRRRGRGSGIREREIESEYSSDSEKPRTPGREIAATESSLGPGETPAASRDEMWQTWTRIPRSHGRHAATQNKFPATPSLTVDRRSVSPNVRSAPRSGRSCPAPQRKPRLHEGISWDGSGNL